MATTRALRGRALVFGRIAVRNRVYTAEMLWGTFATTFLAAALVGLPIALAFVLLVIGRKFAGITGMWIGSGIAIGLTSLPFGSLVWDHLSQWWQGTLELKYGDQYLGLLLIPVATLPIIACAIALQQIWRGQSAKI